MYLPVALRMMARWLCCLPGCEGLLVLGAASSHVHVLHWVSAIADEILFLGAHLAAEKNLRGRMEVGESERIQG